MSTRVDKSTSIRYDDRTMGSVVWSVLGLTILFITAHISFHVWHIDNDRYYSIFHLSAGGLVAIVWYGLIGNLGAAVFLTVVVGLVWEIYEVLMWIYVLKKKRFKPDPVDTRNDLMLDFVGALLAVAWIVLYK